MAIRFFFLCVLCVLCGESSSAGGRDRGAGLFENFSPRRSAAGGDRGGELFRDGDAGQRHADPPRQPRRHRPAGIVHCSIGDWAKFATANLPSGKTKLVKPETLEKLHAPAPGDPPYAMGWIIADKQPWAGGPALTHAGSNTMWFAVAWLAPKKDFAVLVACNQANEKACNEAVLALIEDHFKGEGR